jgi:hypothetical protein
MPVQELDKRIGLLRLLLADVDAREQQRAALSKQYRLQLQHIVEVTVVQTGDLGAALAAMQEVEERLAEVERTGRHLGLVRARAATELEALLLTRRVAEAQAQLAELETRQQDLNEQLARLRPVPAVAAGAESGAAATGDDAAPTPEVSEEEATLRALNEEVQRDIARLHRLILDASERAARTINPGT